MTEEKREKDNAVNASERDIELFVYSCELCIGNRKLIQVTCTLFYESLDLKTLLLPGTGPSLLPTSSNFYHLKSHTQYIQCVRAEICSEVMVPSKERRERQRGTVGEEPE